MGVATRRDVYLNPQYRWDHAADEVSWFHLSEARRCDPTDVFALVETVVPAMRHGQAEAEDAALRALVQQRALPRAAVAFGRWMLTEVPERAVLITMGDLDTFAARGLQSAERLRMGVAVVNVNLLSAWWYGSQVSDRYDLPLPTADSSSSAMETTLVHWRALSVKGTLGRPLVFAPTVPGELIPEGPEPLQLASAYRIMRSQAAPSALGSALGSGPLTPLLHSAGRISACQAIRRQDRSRPGSADAFAPLVLGLALRQAEVLVAAGRSNEPRRLAAWAESFADEAELTEGQSEPRWGMSRRLLKLGGGSSA